MKWLGAFAVLMVVAVIVVAAWGVTKEMSAAQQARSVAVQVQEIERTSRELARLDAGTERWEAFVLAVTSMTTAAAAGQENRLLMLGILVIVVLWLYTARRYGGGNGGQ